jgi:Domain of unknown function DUF11
MSTCVPGEILDPFPKNGGNVFSAALLVAASLLGPPSATADIAVDLDAITQPVLLQISTFDVTVTNHGPDPVTSATVVVQFDARAYPPGTSPCAYDATAKTLTCTFGPLAVGGTATISTTILFPTNGPPTTYFNTATRTASTPTDPNSTNDSDQHNCVFLGGGFPPSPVQSLYC